MCTILVRMIHSDIDYTCNLRITNHIYIYFGSDVYTRSHYSIDDNNNNNNNILGASGAVTTNIERWLKKLKLKV